jgi:hypothetical protein
LQRTPACVGQTGLSLMFAGGPNVLIYWEIGRFDLQCKTACRPVPPARKIRPQPYHAAAFPAPPNSSVPGSQAQRAERWARRGVGGGEAGGGGGRGGAQLANASARGRSCSARPYRASRRPYGAPRWPHGASRGSALVGVVNPGSSWLPGLREGTGSCPTGGGMGLAAVLAAACAAAGQPAVADRGNLAAWGQRVDKDSLDRILPQQRTCCPQFFLRMVRQNQTAVLLSQCRCMGSVYAARVQRPC